MRKPGSASATAALALFGLFLALAVPLAGYKSARELRHALLSRHETPYQARTRTFGAGYTDAIEEIRRTIPPGGAYLLLNADDHDEGGPIWVRFDLAPRRAVYLGKLKSLTTADRLRRRAPKAARWVIIARGPYHPPVLIERFRFIRQLPASSGPGSGPGRPKP